MDRGGTESETAGLLLVMYPEGGLRPDFRVPGVAAGVEDAAGWGADAGGATELWSSRATICNTSTPASATNSHSVICCHLSTFSTLNYFLLSYLVCPVTI